MQHKTLAETRDKMDKSLKTFEEEILHIRTGRASTGLVDNLEVEVYGQKMRMNELATISTPEARLISIQPWDKSNIASIERALQESPIDVNPRNDGTLIRIPLPELSEERRKEYVKLVGKLVEEARVSIRNIRRHELDTVKKQQKDGELPEDDAHRLSDEIQKVTDSYIAKVEDAFKRKEKEIMEV